MRRFGATGNGRTLDTVALNATIAAAHAAGGGTVVLPAGDYLCHSIRLQSWITLELRAGATLIAADPPPAGQPGGYDAPEDGPPNHYQDFGHSRFRNSLIWGEHLEGVTIRGPGRIYGRGLSRGNGRIALPAGQVAPQPPGHLPDVLEADGDFPPFPDPLHPGPFGYPHAKDTLPAGVGNKAIALRACRQVTIRDLTILHGGHFAILAAACDQVVIDGVFIDTNRDGIDIDACANVRIAHCSVNSPWDDGICIKSSCGFGGLRPVENVTVSDCYVSGFTEGTLYDGTRERVIRHRGGPIGRIKLGTEASGGFRNIAITNCIFEFCRGLALEQVDGAPMEDVVVSNLTLREVMNAPIFIRVGARLRAPGARMPGTAARIAISNVIAYDVAPEHGIFIAGLPGHPVTDVRLASIQLHGRGGGTRADAARTVPELPAGYPEPMLFGTLPAWGLYVRHAARIQVRDLSLHLLGPDERPAIALDDVSAADLAGIRGPTAGDWTVSPGSTVRAHDCDGRPDAIT
ncbi:Pectate lyase superfamily protein [Lacunisphaera limnophila]|uniref:Pectate lyase superfamily protein n=1 Tax=Lacunisphaera limnophila TaxID=1838286 RepID=A0A1D8ATZ0_9BACT|nr:right-handed parallel beta-helix repeat-containing protein [Lacunisphaera limnophila]AOS44358.1 Pectate lyase superfamily protein [Lacunisphaera limnophila]